MSRLGIISDTHDRLDKVRAAVAVFNKLEPDRVVHCGDVVAQFVLVELARLRSPVTLVYGNCDGDRSALAARAAEFGLDIADGPRLLEHAGCRLMVAHQPLAALPSDCDFFLHGHTHRLEHRPGKPAVINPGEACGWITGRATAAILDCATGAVAFLDL